jgi:sulfide:quinone oxidoreductase
MSAVTTHVVVLGAGFGGLEVASRLSEVFGDEVRITLIDKSEAFVFGFSKFELMLGRETLEEVRSYYRDIAKPGVEFRQEAIASIDPVARRVTTDREEYIADYLVVGLGADYDIDATPGLREGGQEFYSVEGALKLRDSLPSFTGGHVIISVLSEPFKCPPAPCEAAMLLDEYFTERSLTQDVQISVVSPWGRPIPPSPGASQAILDRFAERGIAWMPQTLVTEIDPARQIARLRDGGELNYELFLGIPRHRVPNVVESSGLAVDGWIPVDKTNLATRFENVYAIGDVTSVGVPKAGLFAESAGLVVAENIISRLREAGTPEKYAGAGACYIEFGEHRVGRVDVDFLTGPSVTAPFTEASAAGAEQKRKWAQSRRARWFDRKNRSNAGRHQPG